MTRNLPSLIRATLVVALVAAFLPARAAAQSPTGTLSGRVYDQNGGVVAGATVTIESPSLQGKQSARTSENGDYIFKFLPPGSYTATFERQGFAVQRESFTVAPTESMEKNITLQASGVQESVVVTATPMSTIVNTPESATNLQKTLIERLPTSRSLTSYVELAPAVHATGPNGNLSISGAMSFDNLFLLNGAVIQDNVRAEPLDLYIEDAVQEVTTANSGISAEYGRFQGGVVTAVTRSGGNAFSGSYRVGLTNDDWRTRTPFDEPKTNKTVPTHEFTLGGPIVRDRLWFFGAARMVDQTAARQTSVTKIPYTRESSQERFEGKATARATDRDRLQVGYMGIAQKTTNSSGAAIGSGVMDLASLITRTDPQSLLTVNYTRTMGTNLFFEAQASRRYSAIQGAGGKITDQVRGTPILDGSTNFSFWQPGFCGVCDEERSNDDIYAKGSYFLSTKGGSHHMTFGYDMFNDRRKGDNGQSGSQYWVISTASLVDGTTVYPVIGSESALVIHWPITESSRGTNFRTHSLFYQDDWSVTRHLTLSLGVRYDKNDGRDSADNLVAKDGLVSPRLGLVWDPAGNGRTTFNASWGRYTAGLTNTIANSASPAGMPSILVYIYEGPDVNFKPNTPLVPTEQALTTVFNWFNANRSHLVPIQNTRPGVLTQITGSLQSPHSDDLSVGISRQLGARGAARFDVVRRTFSDFYSERTDLTTGQVETEDVFGDLTLIENTNELTRTYTAFNAQASYRAGSRLDMGGSYTLSALKGNFDGEDPLSGPLPSDVHYYPEYSDQSWSRSTGYLSADQRHRVRGWANLVLPAGSQANRLSLGVIQQLESGTPYGAAGIISLSDTHGDPYVDNPGYATPPDQSLYFFTPRDEFHTDWMYRTDLAVNFSRRFGSMHRAEAFVQFQVLNVFNAFQAFNNGAGEIDTTILTFKNDVNLVPFNPFTDKPVKGVNWDYSDTFGQPVAAAAYTTPRTFRASVGFRF